MIRFGWALAALGLVGYITTAALVWSSWWVLVWSGLLWLAAAVLADAYADEARTMDLDEACDLIDSEQRAARR